MLKFRLIGGIQIFMMIGALLLSACGASEPELTPTLTFSPDEIRTQAVGTFSADLTVTAFAAPTNTPAPTADTAANPHRRSLPAQAAWHLAQRPGCHGFLLWTFVCK